MLCLKSSVSTTITGSSPRFSSSLMMILKSPPKVHGSISLIAISSKYSHQSTRSFILYLAYTSVTTSDIPMSSFCNFKVSYCSSSSIILTLTNAFTKAHIFPDVFDTICCIPNFLLYSSIFNLSLNGSIKQMKKKCCLLCKVINLLNSF